MPGEPVARLTAYFGPLDRGQPKAGEVVLVSAAAGAVGSVAGQIAKIKGCTVIGSVGTQQKYDWLKELGFDHVFNYKQTSVDEALKQFAPDGIDLYFDNVGDYSSTALHNHMKLQGRVVLCGTISQYNDTADCKERRNYTPIIMKLLGRSGAGYSCLFASPFCGSASHGTGKLTYRETVTEGFERMPEAFISLVREDNIGKAPIKV